MALESILGKEKDLASPNKAYPVRALASTETNYSLFSEQYLEPPVVFGDYNLSLTPSISFWKLLPTPDDY